MPSTKEKKPAISNYVDFISSLQLYTIGLKESSCEIRRDEYWSKDEKRISYKLNSVPVSVKDESFDAISNMTLTIMGETSKACVLKVNASYDLHFHGSCVTKEFVDKFCESEIRLIVWPYFREFITNVSARMHVPPVILPLSDKEEE